MRFSLRTMLLVVVSLCMCAAITFGRLARQGTALRMIAHSGGFVTFDEHPPWLERLSNAVFSDNRLLTVKEVQFYNAPLATCDRRAFQLIASVRSVRIIDATLSVGDIEAITTCRGVCELSLHGCSFDDLSLAALRRVQGIEVLDLGMSSASDSVIPTVLEMNGLHTLHAHGTRLTDGGLMRLSALPSLQKMSVSTHPISCRGIREFRRQRAGIQLQVFGSQCVEE